MNIETMILHELSFYVILYQTGSRSILIKRSFGLMHRVSPELSFKTNVYLTSFANMNKFIKVYHKMT